MWHKSRESYEAFSNKELLQVLQVFSGGFSRNKEMTALCLIGLYTGMRINEIASITIDDVKEIEGVLCLKSHREKRKLRHVLCLCITLSSAPLVLSLREKPQWLFVLSRQHYRTCFDGKRSTWHTTIYKS